MNENLDLCEILKGCPIGTKLYSTLLGDVYLREVDQTNEKIVVALGTHGGCTWTFYKGGNYFPFCKVCLLFPSKDQLDWSKFKGPKFDPTDLKPFDKVLIKRPGGQWGCDFFSDISMEPENEKVYCVGMIGYECIPYNDETKHLVGTSDDCPEYYKWWEE